jgi:hypothetical protein
MTQRGASLLAAMTILGLILAGSPASASPAPAALATATQPIIAKVVGDGTPQSCTSTRLAAAVRSGGEISFNCGPDPVTITVGRTLFTCNTHNCKHPWQGGKAVTKMLLDGGGLVTLSGGGVRGIYYSNSCEQTFGWLSSRCDLDTTLHVVFKDITFTRGNAAKGFEKKASVGGGGGGGAIAMRGGKLTVLNSTFVKNRCMSAHSDGGGGAIRVVGVRGAVQIRDSLFTGNFCANGGAISSLGSPVSVIDSVLQGNTATGTGASSGKGGNGGGLYFDGSSQNVRVLQTTITGNKVGAGGSGVFYVSNNRGGTLSIESSTITGNTGEKFWTGSYRDIFYLGKKLTVTGSVID